MAVHFGRDEAMSYSAFLGSKKIESHASGFSVSAVNDALFPFQQDIVSWALERGKAALFEDCGLGKTPQQLEWAHHVSEREDGAVLILAPLAVSHQTVREGKKFGIEVTLAQSDLDIRGAGIYVTNYEKLHHFPASKISGIVLDECFAKNTLIDTPSGRKHIQDIQVGDFVINCAGVDRVSDTHRREVQYAVLVEIAGTSFIASPNHPIFTQRGWVGAQHLRSGDYALGTGKAMRLVWDDFPTEIRRSVRPEILRDILLSEMAYDTSGSLSASAFAGSSRETRGKTASVVSVRESGCISRIGAHHGFESEQKPESTSKNLSQIESNETRTLRAWGQWEGNDVAASINDGCSWRRMGSGISFIIGPKEARIPNMLQARLRESEAEARNRGGWRIAQGDESSYRSEAGRDDSFVRVDGIEILEQGDPRLEQFREADGKLYFYDLGATRHPSYSVNGVLVHNSSILKSYTGATRNQLIERFADIPYRLCCTATPAPNDHVELGNHSEFFGVLTRTEMLSTFFVHDGGDTSKWRLKGHAEEEFWKWACSWAVMLRRPSDLGYADDEFKLPNLNLVHHVIQSDKPLDGYLFAQEAKTLNERRQARRASLQDRVRRCVDLVATKPNEPWLIWCDLNDEGDLAEKLIPNAIQVAGRHTDEQKEDRMIGFTEGRYQILVSKPSVAGWGMNWQHCPNVAFLGLSDSFEMYYQAIRRVWRFGQKKQVDCHIITSEAEGAVVKNIERKEKDALKMAQEMVKHMSVYNKAALHKIHEKETYTVNSERSNRWEIRLGDCVEGAKATPENSVDYSIFSPPFSSLYTYSASERDMGNVRSDKEFAEHFAFLIPELYRILKPGRLLSFHCMNLPSSKERDGVIGLKDFRGQLIRMFQDAGFIYHSEVVIWKDPVTAMQRTKAIGLLHKQLVKDSCMSRQGIPDYLVTMRKPGINPERVAGTLDRYVGDQPFKSSGDKIRDSINIWQQYASPVWDDINPSDTLQRESAREDKDERHICPLQLQVIERAVQLWTNPDDLVYTPFAGIGSEIYVALKMGRRGLGDELKESYWKQAVANCKAAEQIATQDTLFAAIA